MESKCGPTGLRMDVFSRVGAGVQWRMGRKDRATGPMKSRLGLFSVGALIAVSLCACHPRGERHDDTPALGPGCRPTPSGLPVPRYVSLKHDPANARGGPGDDYKLLWIYHARGLPLLVVEETAEWRRVRDPDGGLAWVHKRVLDGDRTVMRVSPSELPLRANPSDTAQVTAILAGRAVAALGPCQDGWCRISVDHAKGWAPQNALWGASDPPPGPDCPHP